MDMSDQYRLSLLYEKNLTIPKGQSESVIEEEQKTQWPKEKVQKDKQRSTKHTNKTGLLSSRKTDIGQRALAQESTSIEG
jgi:hypothetical protein